MVTYQSHHWEFIFFKVCAFRIIHRVFCDFIWNKNDAFIPPLFVDWYSFRDEQTVSWKPCNSYLRILVTLGQPCISCGIAMQSSTVKSKSKWEIENICTKHTVCLFINAKSQSISFFIGSSLHQDLYQINTTSQDGDLNVLLNCLTCIIWIGWISSDSSVVKSIGFVNRRSGVRIWLGDFIFVEFNSGFI